MRCKQETDLVIELSRQADDHNVSWAVVESNRQTLDDEMVAEALAWSYEHPSPRENRLKLDLSNKGFEGSNSACWSPTLLTHRRALLAKLDRGSGAFDQGGIGEEGLRLLSACGLFAFQESKRSLAKYLASGANTSRLQRIGHLS